MISLFYVQSWLPTLVTMAGLAPANAALAAVCLSLGGIIGGIAIGVTAPRLGLKRLVVGAFLCGAAAIVLFGFLPANMIALLSGAGLVGFFLLGGMIGLYAIVAHVPPPPCGRAESASSSAWAGSAKRWCR